MRKAYLHEISILRRIFVQLSHGLWSKESLESVIVDGAVSLGYTFSEEVATKHRSRHFH